MPEIKEHAPNTFCAVELATTDTSAAAAFYGALFNWTAENIAAGEEGGVYTKLNLHGKEAAAMFELGGPMAGMPPHWRCYVSVDSAQEAAERLTSAGGTVLMPPRDALDTGRTAVFADPSGAVFFVWQPGSRKGVQVIDEPGSLAWCELTTTDYQAAKQFYGMIFGWQGKTTEKDVIYTEWMVPGRERPVGGMLQMAGEWEGIPPHWMCYFAVEDCDATIAKAVELGGAVTKPPQDVEGVGRFAVIADPQGAIFAVITFAN